MEQILVYRIFTSTTPDNSYNKHAFEERMFIGKF